jgi:hypothetical protein
MLRWNEIPTAFCSLPHFASSLDTVLVASCLLYAMYCTQMTKLHQTYPTYPTKTLSEP